MNNYQTQTISVMIKFYIEKKILIAPISFFCGILSFLVQVCCILSLFYVWYISSKDRHWVQGQIILHVLSSHTLYWRGVYPDRGAHTVFVSLLYHVDVPIAGSSVPRNQNLQHQHSCNTHAGTPWNKLYRIVREFFCKRQTYDHAILTWCFTTVLIGPTFRVEGMLGHNLYIYIVIYTVHKVPYCFISKQFTFTSSSSSDLACLFDFIHLPAARPASTPPALHLRLAHSLSPPIFTPMLHLSTSKPLSPLQHSSSSSSC